MDELRDHKQVADKVKSEIMKKLSPEEKLKLTLDLYYSARELKASALRADHPGWSEEEIQKKVKEIFMYARS